MKAWMKNPRPLHLGMSLPCGFTQDVVTSDVSILYHPTGMPTMSTDCVQTSQVASSKDIAHYEDFVLWINLYLF
jgi:hypothetical protein